ncbi:MULTISPECIES: glycoside hydrolase family 36 protein [unclassified Isoptericola]|uniref:glycoside hydrolase family 36 protein n=1 Tax=unclassified Isoptericola TaxID=2623355 RepID=UPI0036674897
MLLEDHQLSLVDWSELSLGLRLGTGGGCRVLGVHDEGAVTRIRLKVVDGGQVILQSPLGDACGYWYPGLGGDRGLPADWEGSDRFSAIRSAPLGALYDADGRSQLAFGCSWTTGEGELQFGVSEEEKNFVVRLPVDGRVTARTDELELVLLRDSRPVAVAVRTIVDALYAGTPVRQPARAAVEPVYSTWYAYSQRISAETVGRDLPVAADLGFGSVFLDDGWQRFGDGRWYTGCGDWMPDTEKFPDLTAFVESAHGHGLDVVLWLAPLLVGEQSDAYARLQRFATSYSAGLRAWVLDPRHREVREHVAITCGRLVADYGLDGLKIDFLNNAMAYAGTPSTGDLDDVGFAMVDLLQRVAETVDASRPGALVEFRQPYVSPVVGAYADVVRATDCPADADQNRMSVVDLRVLGGGQVVHADPIMWAPEASAESVSRQLFAGFFGVPQVSMPLGELSEEHRRTVARELSLWRALRGTLLGGDLEVGPPNRGYPVVQARRGDQLVVVAYEAAVADLNLEGVRELVVVNATPTPGVAYRVVAGGVDRLAPVGFLEVPPWSVVRRVGA